MKTISKELIQIIQMSHKMGRNQQIMQAHHQNQIFKESAILVD